jgi:ATP-binding cassette subfamily B protein
MAARRRSLVSLEKLRLFHAAVTVVLTIALLAWAIMLWQNGVGTAGDVVLVCTLGLSILHATRDLAVALVDDLVGLTGSSAVLRAQLIASVRGASEAGAAFRSLAASVAFEDVSFTYPDGRKCSRISAFTSSLLSARPAGSSGCGKSTLFVLLQRFYDAGRMCAHWWAGLSQVTQSLRAAIAVVPQDVSLFHRSIIENIRYGRPEASDAEGFGRRPPQIVGFYCNLPDGLATIVGDRA